MRVPLAMFVLCLNFGAQVSWATPLERSLPVSVFITANQDASGLEIIADKYIYQSTYNTSIKTFSPLSIPFNVRSTNGQNISYDIFMSHLGGQCDGESLNLVVSDMFGGGGITLNERHRFAGVDNEHGIIISFPVIPQLAISQQCEGHIGLIAEIVV